MTCTCITKEEFLAATTCQYGNVVVVVNGAVARQDKGGKSLMGDFPI
jgi:hypothetical protein